MFPHRPTRPLQARVSGREASHSPVRTIRLNLLVGLTIEAVPTTRSDQMGRQGVGTSHSKRRAVVGASAFVLASVASIAAIETSSGVSATSANLVRDPAFLTGVPNWSPTAGRTLSMVDVHAGRRAIRML